MTAQEREGLKRTALALATLGTGPRPHITSSTPSQPPMRLPATRTGA